MSDRENTPSPFIHGLLLSTGAHFFVFFALMALPNLGLKKGPKKLSKKSLDRHFQIIKAERLRHLGTKNGIKRSHFNLPVTKIPSKPKTNRQLKKAEKKNQSPPSRSHRKVSLNSLSITTSKGGIQRYKTKPRGNLLSIAGNTGKEKYWPQVKRINRRIKKDIFQGGNFSKIQSSILNTSNLEIDFKMPQGVSQDKLNQKELMYYGFRKRVFEGYISSLLKTYNEMELTRPRIGRVVPKINEILSGKITFDREGNIRKINIIQWSRDDDLQALFQNTLEGINGVPNPPKSVIKGQSSFEIYYQLHLRGA